MTEDLVAWLRAALDEDERVARAVLAEVEAKRRILDLHQPNGDPDDDWYGSDVRCLTCGGVELVAGYGERGWRTPWPCLTIRLLALPYADRDGYRDGVAPVKVSINAGGREVSIECGDTNVTAKDIADQALAVWKATDGSKTSEGPAYGFTPQIQLDNNLPNWVYDVVIALAQWSDHPVLYREGLRRQSADGVWQDVYEKVDDCGCRALTLVPSDVVERAEAIRSYLDRRMPSEAVVE